MADTPRLLLCDCTGTMRPDAGAIAKGCGLACDQVHTHLCRSQAAIAVSALQEEGEVIIACGQEAPAFLELAEDLGAADRLTCVDIRDRAGWSDDQASPKMAALIAEARIGPAQAPVMDVQSEGLCLVYGAGEAALTAAARLSSALSVTCLLTEQGAADAEGDFDLVAGRITHASGALGQFALQIDGFAELAPAGRGRVALGMPGMG